MSTTQGTICGAARPKNLTVPNGPAADYCMTTPGHDGPHIYSARDDYPPATDDGYCPAEHLDASDAKLYCERNEGHTGEHRAASDIVGSRLQRLVTWTTA